MLHRRPPSGGDKPKETSNQRSAHSKFIDAVAWTVLLTLLAANFFALVFHVAFFLPDHDGVFDVVASSSGEAGAGLHRGGTATAAKKRIRPSSMAFGDPSAVAALLRRNLLPDGAGGSSMVRYDAVPAILGDLAYGVVHQLPSIPDRRRMIPSKKGGDVGDEMLKYGVPSDGIVRYRVPSNAVHNRTYFLEARLRPDEEDRPLFVYNPMVLPLDDNVIDASILSNLSVGDEAKYVGVYRVSNFANCQGPGLGVPDTYKNYLGLALLDRDLNILPQNGGGYLDVVIDLNHHLFDIGWTPRNPRGHPANSKQYMQDCQLFAVGGHGACKADQLILLCNEYAMPVKLELTRTREGSNVAEEEQRDDGETIRLANHYGTGLQLTVLQRPNVIQLGGKNFHYFQAAADLNNDGAPRGPGFLEMWPGGPHEFVQMDFVSYPYVHRGRTLNVTKSSKAEPEPSYVTMDVPKEGQRGTLIDRDSGSACCVPIRWTDDDIGNERQLLLGFSHRKTRKGVPKSDKYNYVSRVYAFEPTPPFDIVARSGFFCLGFAHQGDEALQSDNEQVFGAANEFRLRIHDEEFDCPRIHFVTGIAEKVGDSETVIVSYGVNDCYPRMVEVPKNFLVGLLKA